MTVTDFHRLAVELELESIMLTTQQFTEAFGALNWRENSTLEMLANVSGQHPLKLVLTALAEWLDCYEQGTATSETWLKAMQDASHIQGIADHSIHDFNNRNNAQWQAAKATAAGFVQEQRLVMTVETGA